MDDQILIVETEYIKALERMGLKREHMPADQIHALRCFFFAGFSQALSGEWMDFTNDETAERSADDAMKELGEFWEREAAAWEVDNKAKQ